MSRNAKGRRFSKRAFDVVVSGVALLVFAPVLAACALWIKLVSRGPVFYFAPRVGYKGRTFLQYKLRTMHVNADRQGAFTAKDDPRIIAGGNLIRLLRFDEIPQFLNVLKGEMSVVGPRPENVETVEEHFDERMRTALDILPGLTGIRQIRNWPDCCDLTPDGAEDEQQYYLDVILPYSIEMDLEYVRRQSFWFDVRLLAATAWALGVKTWWIPLFGGRTSRPEDALEGLPRSARERLATRS